MARRRRRRKPVRWVTVAGAAVVILAGYSMLRPDSAPSKTAPSRPRSQPLGGVPLAGITDSVPSEKPKENKPAGPAAQNPSSPETKAPTAPSGVAMLSTGQESLKKNDLIAARTQLNQAVLGSLPPEAETQARRKLDELAQDTIFSPRLVQGDPLVTNYVVKPGDNLEKIAREQQITAELLVRVNQLKDKNVIRAGQNLKIIHGPFNVRISKKKHQMDVYLQDVLVGQRSVGLGEEGSTPTGTWAVKNKLTNPTYYPPRGGQIVAANDPQNPLGERWIGLAGAGGEAVGQERYGIHGTNDPQSIGQNKSLGCIRMHNADVEWIYDLLVEKHSEVQVVD